MAGKKETETPIPKVATLDERAKDLVLVRAIGRGYSGHAIRNEQEVFEMSTAGMRAWPLAAGEKPRDTAPTIITTPCGEFELPSGVVLAKRKAVKEEELVPHGHKTAHGIQNGDVL